MSYLSVVKKRRPERVRELLDLIEAVWTTRPGWDDQRLGQLLINVMRLTPGLQPTGDLRRDLWNLEDDVLIDALLATLREQA